jgi:hypothetical protein
METAISTTEDLEKRISGIIGKYRQEAYEAIEEKMWTALIEAGICILENEGLFLMSRRAINGVSITTLNNVCRILEEEGDFRTIDELHKKAYIIEFIKARTLSFEVTRLKYPNYLKPWTEDDDAKLERLWCEGTSIKDLAERFGRNPGAIDARIEKLELIEKYGQKPELCV